MAVATVTRTDEQIQTDVLAELRWDARVRPNEIGVVVKDGVVTLSGYVDSYAKLWAADAGHRVAHTTVHVHGGVGIDLDGEAHRFFTGAKRNEFALGGATEQARTVGRLLAAEA